MDSVLNFNKIFKFILLKHEVSFHFMLSFEYNVVSSVSLPENKMIILADDWQI